MRYSLMRLSDGRGDSGPMCLILDPKTGSVVPEVTRPMLGHAVRVGSFYGRSYSGQDWWQCTPITEILEEREDYIKFRTTNSVYEWKTF